MRKLFVILSVILALAVSVSAQPSGTCEEKTSGAPIFDKTYTGGVTYYSICGGDGYWHQLWPLTTAGVTANAIGYSQLDTSTLQTATVTITTAQIKALHGTPVSIIATPGSGKFIEVLSILYEYNYGTAVFATGTSAPNLYYAGTSGQAIGTNGLASAILTTGTSGVTMDVPVFPTVTTLTATSAIANVAVVFGLADTTNYTSATGTSTITIQLVYRVRTL
jgi:hypothetical protein